jgi:hypothetical protein
MKKVLVFLPGLLVLAIFSFYLTGCGDKEKIKSLELEKTQLNKSIDSVKEIAPAYWENYFDTLGAKQIYAMAPPLRPRPIEPWLRTKTYTLCLNTNLTNGAKGVIVTIAYPNSGRVILELKIANSGTTQVRYVHMNNKVVPEISIQVVDRNGKIEDCDVKDSTHSSCSPGFTVKDKVSSTSGQGSTVQVTIDER